MMDGRYTIILEPNINIYIIFFGVGDFWVFLPFFLENSIRVSMKQVCNKEEK